MEQSSLVETYSPYRDFDRGLIGDEGSTRIEARLQLLEVGSNIFRDAESLLGIAWATA
jgi:hypothetical protein